LHCIAVFGWLFDATIVTNSCVLLSDILQVKSIRLLVLGRAGRAYRLPPAKNDSFQERKLGIITTATTFQGFILQFVNQTLAYCIPWKRFSIRPGCCSVNTTQQVVSLFGSTTHQTISDRHNTTNRQTDNIPSIHPSFLDRSTTTAATTTTTYR